MGRLAAEIPEEGDVAVRDGSCDVRWGVSQGDWEHFRAGSSGEEARAEGQDASAVAGGAFGEDDNDPILVLLDIGFKID